MFDVRIHRRRRGRIGAFIGNASRGTGTIVAFARRAGEGDHAPARRRQQPRRCRHHARAVETAAERCGHVPHAAQAAADRKVENLARLFGIILRTRERQRVASGHPIAPRRHTGGRDAGDMRRFDALDAAKESARPGFGQYREEIGDRFFIGRVRNIRQAVQALRHAGERKEALAAVIMDRAPAQRVARQKEAALRIIPERESVIADKVIETSFLPTLDGGQKDSRVAQLSGARWRNIEAIGKFVAIVETKIGNQNEPAITTSQGLAIEAVLRKRSHQTAAERDAGAGPLSRGIGTINFLRAQHACASIGGVARPVEIPQSRKSAHRRRGGKGGATRSATTIDLVNIRSGTFLNRERVAGFLSQTAAPDQPLGRERNTPSSTLNNRRFKTSHMESRG